MRYDIHSPSPLGYWPFPNYNPSQDRPKPALLKQRRRRPGYEVKVDTGTGQTAGHTRDRDLGFAGRTGALPPYLVGSSLRLRACAIRSFVRSFRLYVRGIWHEANGFTCLVSVLDVDGGGTVPSKTEQSLWGRRKY